MSEEQTFPKPEDMPLAEKQQYIDELGTRIAEHDGASEARREELISRGILPATKEEIRFGLELVRFMKLGNAAAARKTKSKASSKAVNLVDL